ncbi:MAG: hypothetical protein KH295_10370, partial [Clostridiaceae bacterium]|nr:hypothetical protein [Clostridiaceae bacterium]
MYKGKRKRRTLPLPVALMLDLCGAGLIVFTVYVVVYLMPVCTAPEPQALYTSGAAADSSGVWKERFADHFTDTVVTTDHSYTSPNLSVTVSEHSIGSGSTKAVYYLADVYMADPSCLQTYF